MSNWKQKILFITAQKYEICKYNSNKVCTAESIH